MKTISKRLSIVVPPLRTPCVISFRFQFCFHNHTGVTVSCVPFCSLTFTPCPLSHLQRFLCSALYFSPESPRWALVTLNSLFLCQLMKRNTALISDERWSRASCGVGAGVSPRAGTAHPPFLPRLSAPSSRFLPAFAGPPVVLRSPHRPRPAAWNPLF